MMNTTTNQDHKTLAHETYHQTANLIIINKSSDKIKCISTNSGVNTPSWGVAVVGRVQGQAAGCECLALVHWTVA